MAFLQESSFSVIKSSKGLPVEPLVRTFFNLLTLNFLETSFSGVCFLKKSFSIIGNLDKSLAFLMALGFIPAFLKNW